MEFARAEANSKLIELVGNLIPRLCIYFDLQQALKGVFDVLSFPLLHLLMPTPLGNFTPRP